MLYAYHVDNRLEELHIQLGHGDQPYWVAVQV